MKTLKLQNIGRKYVKELGINYENTPRGIFNSLCQKFDKKEAEKFMDKAYRLREEDTEAFYRYKNEDYDKAMIFSGGYDADIVRRTCDWIAEHRDCFGDTILEVGCDCGFMTYFLAQQFQNSKITSIDRNENALKIARRNTEKFGLSNVEFMAIDAENLNEQSFDTVFSMRTLQENRSEAQIDHIFDDPKVSSDEFVAIVNDYILALSKLLKPGGTLVSIERVDVNPMLLGWLKSLNRCGLVPDLENISIIQAKELGDKSEFTAVISHKGTELAEIEIEKKWMQMLKYDPSKQEWQGWKSMAAYADKADTLVEGFYVVNPEGGKVGKMAYYTVKNAPNNLLYHVCVGEDMYVATLLPKNQEDMIKQNMQSHKLSNQSVGLKIRTISK